MLASVANSLSRRMLSRPHCILGSSSVATVVTRSFGVANKGPHPDPLHLLRQECIARQLCDTEGNRLPGVDWRISIAIADAERPSAVRRNDPTAATNMTHSFTTALNTACLTSSLFLFPTASQPAHGWNRTGNSGRYRLCH